MGYTIHTMTGTRPATEEEIEKQQEFEKEFQTFQENREFTNEELLNLIINRNIQTLALNDNEALRMKSHYQKWETLCAEKKTVKKSFIFGYEDRLYKTLQESFQFQSQWVPGQGTSAIFSQIVKSAKGTLEDPIIVPSDVTSNSFTYVIGKYYKENEHIYKCTRQGDSDGKEYSFPYAPSQLLGQYFELIK